MRTEWFKDGKFDGGPITWGKKEKDADGYFTFMFKVQGDLLTVEADGEEVIRLRDSTRSEAGWIGFKSYRTGASVKKAEVKVLD